ncbi:hypothetical protein, partial [Streptomyces sp. NPDC127112]|uniref:hypothetical protein n=1 Tax=Streptomyces sp. NPDC127112 TaxID=3345364 RepID=UPI003640D7BB
PRWRRPRPPVCGHPRPRRAGSTRPRRDGSTRPRRDGSTRPRRRGARDAEEEAFPAVRQWDVDAPPLYRDG